MESPPSCVPTSRPESGVGCLRDAVRWDISQVGITHLCRCVPLEHRVDCLRKLCAALLVDTARVDPDPSISIPLGEKAAFPDLVGCESTRDFTSHFASFAKGLKGLEGLLVALPCVRENSVASWRDFRVVSEPM